MNADALPELGVSKVLSCDAVLERFLKLQHDYEALLMNRVAANLPCGRVSTRRLASVLQQTPDVAPMRVLPLAVLKHALADGTVGQLRYEDTVDVGDIGETGRVVLISHRWWSSLHAQPDQVHAGWPKVRCILDTAVPLFMETVPECREEDVFLWWDFVSVSQGQSHLKARQISCIPVFVAMADAVFACRSGDEDYHDVAGPRVRQRGGQEMVPYLGKINAHPGHYNNRVWTMCELFMATSPFQRQFRGARMHVFSMELDSKYNLVSGPDDQTRILRSQFHEMHAWSMPPRENLENPEDLLLLEPLVTLMGDSQLPYVIRAAGFGLSRALKMFVSSGHDINARHPVRGEVALHSLARAQDVAMLQYVLSLPEVDVNAQSNIGQVPIHLLVASSAWDFRFDPQQQERCLALLLEAEADPTIRDNRGRSALDVAVARYGVSEAAKMFPGHQEAAALAGERPKITVRHSIADSFKGKQLTEGSMGFPDGDVIRWRRMLPVAEPREDAGQPELMVCLSSACASSWMYIEWAHRMADAGFELILLEPPGAGFSHFRRGDAKNPLDLQETLDSFETTEDLFAYYLKNMMVALQEQGWTSRKFHLVGNSSGGVLTAYLAIHHPQWCRSLTIFGWPFSTRHTPEVAASLKGMGQALIGKLGEGLIAEFDEAMSSFLSASTPQELREIFLYAARPGGDSPEGHSAMNMFSFMVFASLKNLLRVQSIKVPTLVVQGEADAMFIDHALLFQSQMPHCRLAIIPYVGHIPPVENPDDSCNIVLDFLSSCAAANACMTCTGEDLPVIDPSKKMFRLVSEDSSLASLASEVSTAFG